MSLDLCKTSYLQPSGFRVIISKQNYPYLSFMAQQIQHPSLEINAAEVPFRRMQSVPFIGDAITNNQLTVDAIIDENMQVYTEVYTWMQRHIETPHQLNEGSGLADYNDIRVEVLSSSNNTVKTIKYNNAFPVSLGDIQLASTSEDAFITFPITFRFDYFEFF